jgi:hypothetical protein
MNLLHLDAVAPHPWKNGGGTTRELLAWPSAEDWWLRISVADIERDGPFSPFPGVQRWFGVLDGAGVELQWPGRTERLDEWSSLLAFDGGDAPGCRLIAGPTRDINVMHRAARGRVTVVPAGAAPPAGFGWLALFTRDALWLEGGNPYPLDVPPMTLGWGAWKPWRVASGSTTRAWWIAFDDTAETPR